MDNVLNNGLSATNPRARIPAVTDCPTPSDIRRVGSPNRTPKWEEK